MLANRPPYRHCADGTHAPRADANGTINATDPKPFHGSDTRKPPSAPAMLHLAGKPVRCAPPTPESHLDMLPCSSIHSHSMPPARRFPFAIQEREHRTPPDLSLKLRLLASKAVPIGRKERQVQLGKALTWHFPQLKHSHRFERCFFPPAIANKRNLNDKYDESSVKESPANHLDRSLNRPSTPNARSTVRPERSLGRPSAYPSTTPFPPDRDGIPA